MTVFAYFHGGENYSFGGVEDIEEFPSIQAVKDTLQARRNGRDSYYPVVSESASMSVYLTKPDELDNPDKVFVIGPRGGIKEG